MEWFASALGFTESCAEGKDNVISVIQVSGVGELLKPGVCRLGQLGGVVRELGRVSWLPFWGIVSSQLPPASKLRFDAKTQGPATV